MTTKLYVQYGCGWSAPEEWINFDASSTLRFERLPLIGRFYTKNHSRFPRNVQYGDIVKGLPLPLDACRGVYCSHVLEHLCLDDFRVALFNTRKILCQGGIFRLVIPDLEYFIKQYIDDSSPLAAYEFMTGTLLGYTTRQRKVKDFFVAWLGNSRHLWMWDYKSMKKELENAGFVDVRRVFIGDSIDGAFNAVEEANRWENCLGVEARKV